MTQETPMTAGDRARNYLIGDATPDREDACFENALSDLTQAITEAEEAMKERCAKVAEEMAGEDRVWNKPIKKKSNIAVAIRALGEE